MTYEEACKLKPGDFVVCRVAKVDKGDRELTIAVGDSEIGTWIFNNEHAEPYSPPPPSTYDSEAFLRELIVGLVSNNGLLTPDAVFAGALRHRAKYEEHLEQAAQEDE